MFVSPGAWAADLAMVPWGWQGQALWGWATLISPEHSFLPRGPASNRKSRVVRWPGTLIAKAYGRVTFGPIKRKVHPALAP